jgi:hypothetical protein
LDWNNFYTATAGASATLLGLLFVATQMHIGTLTKDPSGRWNAVARSTFYNYLLLFALSLLMLFPASDSRFIGSVILAISGVGAYRLLVVWAPVWRGIFKGRSEKVIEILWWLASPLLTYIALGDLGLEMLRQGMSLGLQLVIGYLVVVLFGIVLRNSWRLLVEMSSDEPPPKS